MDKVRMLNLNVGVLGHVDSGKTSLAKALSTVSSTAAFDKNPQSQERGITIDLGFSSLVVELPDSLKSLTDCKKLQLTFVDCPGHASLIRTVIGGCQIIDTVLLVVDVTTGVQTQTAECLIIAEITCRKMVVVLNKIDLLPLDKRDAMIQKMTKRIRLTLEKTVVFKDAPIVCVSAKPGGADATDSPPLCIDHLVDTLRNFAFLPERDTSSPFLFSVDHCFSIRGQGTVMTGTVLQGVVNVNDVIELPSLRATKKVKSLQMFRQPVCQASAGDRVGVCVTQLDPHQVERGVASQPGHVITLHAAVINIHKIKYFKAVVKSKAKFHVSIGHETVMAKVTVFSTSVTDAVWSHHTEYLYQEELLTPVEASNQHMTQFALLEFEKPVLSVPSCLVIGSKLDTDVHTSCCRLAFHGRLLSGFQDKLYTSTVLPSIRVYKTKQREGVVERVANDMTVIAKGMFKKETDMRVFAGLKVRLSSGEEGNIDGSFGQSGKVKVHIPDGLMEETKLRLEYLNKKKPSSEVTTMHGEPVQVLLTFKKYVFDTTKKIVQ